MSWSVVALILGVTWVLPVMYAIKWYYMNKMFSRQNLQGLDLKQVHNKLLEQAGESEPINTDTPAKGYAAEG